MKIIYILGQEKARAWWALAFLYVEGKSVYDKYKVYGYKEIEKRRYRY